MVNAIRNEQTARYDLAAQLYEKVLSRYPDFSPAQKKLAIIYAKDPSKTERAYGLAIKARESIPNDPELSKALGIIVFQQGDYTRAVNLLQESAAGRSDDAELFYYLGVSQYQLKNRTASKASLQRALNLNLSGKQLEDAKRILSLLN
jgi:Flp pilus assembly protein TadD